MTRLLADLAAAKAERDEAVDDAKATILASRDLGKVLSDANVEVISLQGRQLKADSSLHCLASMLSAKLATTKFKVEALCA
ncbi:hypothetical protein ACLOJK_038191 [Asimina triloba]